jgi:hypothetical protein
MARSLASEIGTVFEGHHEVTERRRMDADDSGTTRMIHAPARRGIEEDSE